MRSPTGSVSRVADLLPLDGDDAGPFDLVLANLPYVRDDAMAGPAGGDVVRADPRARRWRRGLEIIERLVALLPAALAADGVALLEIGSDQGEAIRGPVARLLARLVVPRGARSGRACRGSPGSAEPDVSVGGSASVGHHQAVPQIVTPPPILPIRLVALDIDGTLIGDDLIIGPDTGPRSGPRMRKASW